MKIAKSQVKIAEFWEKIAKFRVKICQISTENCHVSSENSPISSKNQPYFEYLKIANLLQKTVKFLMKKANFQVNIGKFEK